MFLFLPPPCATYSDNSLVGDSERSNHRCYTCILYCNDDWDCKRDGGALRLYRDSVNVATPSDAIDTCIHVDINPSNGQLLIFDSRKIHSVRKVTSKTKKRLAFTLWTLRPEDNNARGEIYDEGTEGN